MTYESNFRIETSRKGTSRSIVLAGELDGGAAEALTEAFRRVIDGYREGELILDMERISFIDSAGLRAIIHIERAADQGGVPLVVTPAPGHVTELLRTAGLSERLTIGPQPIPADTGSFIERTEIALPLDQTAPGRARAAVRELLAERPEDELAVITLLTSELVTNAVIHPRDPVVEAGVRLRITRAAKRARIDVLDHGAGFDPERPRRREPDRGGRGLLLVDQLASRWGAGHVDGEGGPGPGFEVWFELDHASDAGEPGARVSAA